jgi:hypothetical protein
MIQETITFKFETAAGADGHLRASVARPARLLPRDERASEARERCDEERGILLRESQRGGCLRARDEYDGSVPW